MQHCYLGLAIAELSQVPSSTFSKNHYTLKLFTSFQLKISNTVRHQNQNKSGSLPETYSTSDSQYTHARKPSTLPKRPEETDFLPSNE